MDEGPNNTEWQWGLYQELDTGTMEERRYEGLGKNNTAAKDNVSKGEYSRRNDMCTMYVIVKKNE